MAEYNLIIWLKSSSATSSSKMTINNCENFTKQKHSKRKRHYYLFLSHCNVTIIIGILVFINIFSLCDGQKPNNLGGVKRKDVYIAGLFPYGRHVPEHHIGRGVMPSVKLAVDHVNDNSNVLRNYRLHMWWNDTAVSIFIIFLIINICLIYYLITNCRSIY